MSVRAGHFQGVDDEAGAHVVGDLPAHDHAGGGVDHGRQLQPAFTGAQVGDVSHQTRAGFLRREVPFEQIGRILIIHTVHGGDAIRLWLHRVQLLLGHQLMHQSDTAGMPAGIEHLRDTVTPVNLPELV